MVVGIRCADCVSPLNTQNLALTSPTSGGRSFGIVHLRTKAKELSLFYEDIERLKNKIDQSYKSFKKTNLKMGWDKTVIA
jgi:hypothetical protein